MRSESRAKSIHSRPTSLMWSKPIKTWIIVKFLRVFHLCTLGSGIIWLRSETERSSSTASEKPVPDDITKKLHQKTYEKLSHSGDFTITSLFVIFFRVTFKMRGTTGFKLYRFCKYFETPHAPRHNKPVKMPQIHLQHGIELAQLTAKRGHFVHYWHPSNILQKE